MSFRKRLPVMMLCIALMGAVSMPAGAADTSELLIKQGVALRKKDRNREALTKFEQAYQMSHSVRSAAQLGLCEQALGLWVEADLHLSEALTGDADAWIANNRATLEQSLQQVRARLVEVQVESRVTDVEVTVNGQPRGLTPNLATIRVLPGEVSLEARRIGYRPYRETRRAAAGETIRFVLELSVEGGLPLPRAADQPGDALVLKSSPEQGASSAGTSKWVWLGVGGAVLAGAAVAGLLIMGSRYPGADVVRDVQ